MNEKEIRINIKFVSNKPDIEFLQNTFSEKQKREVLDLVDERKPPEGISMDLSKYYKKRKTYFNKIWDDTETEKKEIQYDETGLFSVIPELYATDSFAQVLKTEKLKNKKDIVVFDGFAGIGGYQIAALKRKRVAKVFSSDTSLDRLRMCQHNLGVYGFRDVSIITLPNHEDDFGEFEIPDSKVVLFHGNFFKVLDLFRIKGMRYDLLILDPPWGGTEYTEKTEKTKFIDEDDETISIMTFNDFIGGLRTTVLEENGRGVVCSLRIPSNFYWEEINNLKINFVASKYRYFVNDEVMCYNVIFI